MDNRTPRDALIHTTVVPYQGDGARNLDEEVIERYESSMKGGASRNSKPVAGVADVAAPPEEWGEPEHLSEQVDALPYPVDALPRLLRDAVVEVQGVNQAPLAMVSCSALSTLSVAAQGLANVRRDAHLCGPISVYVLVVADSGERKTACDGFFGKVLRDWESAERERVAPFLAESEANYAAFEARKAGLVDAIRQASKQGKDTHEVETQLRELSKDAPARLVVPRLLYVDVTPEQLAYSIATGSPSGGVLSAEAGSVFGANAMGHDAILRNLALLNVLWDGGEMTVDRRTKECFRLRGRRLSFGLMVQASALEGFIERAGTLPRGTGFFARFLVCKPTSTQGDRPYRKPPEYLPALDRFSQRIRRLLDTAPLLDEEGCLTPPDISFSPEALSTWIKFHDDVELELGAVGEFRDIRDVASKAAENAARMAGLFHMLEHGVSGSISGQHMAAAGRVMAWHLIESRRLFAEIDAPKPLADAIRLDSWLRAEAISTDSNLVSTQRIRQFGPGRTRENKDFRAAIAELEARDRARFESQGAKRFVAVNPALMEIRP